MQLYCGQRIDCGTYLVGYRLSDEDYYSLENPCVDCFCPLVVYNCAGEIVCVDSCSWMQNAELLGYVAFREF